MNNIERRVLAVAYYFPPMGLSGVQRPLKFVKYLPQFGWTPTVLTVEPGGYYAIDESLNQEVQQLGIRVVRTKAAGPGKVFARNEVVKLPSESRRKFLARISDTFFIPDNKIGWKKDAVAAALSLHRDQPFDLIFATAPPFTDFLIGKEIKEIIDKPLVFDYRDPWVDYPFKFYPTPMHRWYTQHLERGAVRASSHIITTNRRVKELLIHRYPFLTYRDIDIIPQGFDPEDMARAGAESMAGNDRPRTPGVMRITYAGVFWEDRVPDHFLLALRGLLDEFPDAGSSVEAWFVGNVREENVGLVERLGLQNVVNFFGYRPHNECVRLLLESDLLWMIVGDDVGSPGKAYEYIGTGKPILGLVPDGFLRSTILEAGGRVAPPGDVPSIKSALREFFLEFRNGTLRGPSPEVIKKYDRRTLTGSLVKVFESLMDT